jgi:hypothetical protein
LPPFAFSCAIALGRQLQLRYPRIKMFVGVWGFSGDPARGSQRFMPARPSGLATSLAEAVQFVVTANPPLTRDVAEVADQA